MPEQQTGEGPDGQFRQMKEQESKLRLALKLILDDAAFNRLSLMRMSNERLYSQIVQYLFSLFNSGKAKSKVNEEQLKKIAMMFVSQKKEGTITRFSK